MPIIQVEELIKVTCDREKLYTLFSDFGNWRKWAPWLISDPQSFLDTSEDGLSSKWEGRAIGTGRITKISCIENESLSFEVVLLDPKPFRVSAEIQLTKEGNETLISWSLTYKISWFKSLLKSNLKEEVAFDFKRGLKIVKDVSQNGEIESMIEMVGVHRRFGYEYIGIKRTISIDDIPKYIEEDFGKLIPFSKSNIPERDRPWPFIIYHKWDVERYEVTMSCCVSLFQIPDEIPEGMILGETKGTRLFSVTNIGGHRHIANTWRALNYMKKAGLIDVDESAGYEAMEYFRSGPIDVSEGPIKSDFIVPLNEVDIMSEKVYVSR